MYQQRLSLSDECFVKGTVERVIYYNRESGYGVCLFRVSESSEPVETEEVTVVGLMASPQEGLTYTCRGEWESHPRYGEQFRVKRMEQDMPRSREAVIKYLSSDLFPGIGPKTATKIVSELGDDALKKIVDNPELLQGIPGVSEKKAEIISDTVRQHTDFEQVMLFIYEYGIGSALALKIYNTYKHDTLAVLKQNPVPAHLRIEGIGFARADAIGRETGIPEGACPGTQESSRVVRFVASGKWRRPRLLKNGRAV